MLSKLVFFTTMLVAVGCSELNFQKAQEHKVLAPKTLTASGQSLYRNEPSLTQHQIELAAEQASKMQAYRRLAALLYQVNLTDGKTVGGQVIADESYRLYFDLFLREAKVTALQSLGNAVHITLSLPVTSRFFQCIDGSLSTVRLCLQQDDKVAFTRLGTTLAEVKAVNLGCSNADCSGLFHVGGFDQRKNILDRGLLNAGLYDSEWALNSTGRLFLNYILLNGIPK